ncbi:Carboxylesterase NlhH [Paraglaciecola mesophila]|uniref:Carboxylesterase NlhH n=1 Tax=Paraglaciecola mesophila TaxID=197222 RepID=A0A857JFA5_9ALTE|nr:alpha/beta hydrolase [Paraglaciecola mesophila]QHJ10699.1 Carboxylesterase NlhH [Paraglaciecola mesophila]
MRIAIKVTVGLVGALAVIVGALFFHVNASYPNVDSELRLFGYVVDRFTQAETPEQLIALGRQAEPENYDLDKGIVVEETYIKGRDGNNIRVVILRSDKSTPDAVGLLYLHGGGYVMGSPDSALDIRFMSDLIHTSNTVIVAPAYRLSHEAPYPAALNDSYATLAWMKDNAAELGINDSQLFIAGGSAGGGLTAATTLYARDQGEINIAFQMPLYPMLDDRNSAPSNTQNTHLIWNSTKNRMAWKLYLGDLYQTDKVPIYAAPSRATDLSGLPPTFTFVGDQDLFYDETNEFVQQLKKDGVPVEFYEYEGGYHVFEMIVPNANVSQSVNERLLAAFKHASENYFATQN